MEKSKPALIADDVQEELLPSKSKLLEQELAIAQAQFELYSKYKECPGCSIGLLLKHCWQFFWYIVLEHVFWRLGSKGLVNFLCWSAISMNSLLVPNSTRVSSSFCLWEVCSWCFWLMPPKALALSSRKSSMTWAIWSSLGNVISAKKQAFFAPSGWWRKVRTRKILAWPWALWSMQAFTSPSSPTRSQLRKEPLCLWSQMTPPFPRRGRASELPIDSQGGCNEFWQNFWKNWQQSQYRLPWAYASFNKNLP